MPGPLESTLAELTDIQRRAVEWNEGPMLVLAGPGSGKTRVLTCRIARLLDSSRDRRFRILALTFTNKAAAEMSGRVNTLAPDLEGRTSIDTFHGFCAQVLRQHGVHLGIKSDFAIFSQTADREAVLDDALRREGSLAGRFGEIRLLPLIDYLKTRLIEPDDSVSHLQKLGRSAAANASAIATAYRLYETELRRTNALDFNSLIFEAYRLFAYPVMARHYHKTYRYWMIDEFQDTNGAQYALLRRMAGSDFREVFAVADDDQTIFEWNGANVRRIGQLVKDFSCTVIQLPTNFRCPPRIVEAANRLVVFNAVRADTKQPAKSAWTNSSLPNEEQIGLRAFDSDTEEAEGIAGEIEHLDADARANTAVLARNRALLEMTQQALTELGVPAEVVARRDDFVSPQMRWFVACLKQINRPLDRRNMSVLMQAFNDFADVDLNREELASRSETDGVNLLDAWLSAVRAFHVPQSIAKMIDVIANLTSGHVKLPLVIREIPELLEHDEADGDLGDDLSAWRRISREVRTARSDTSLDQFLQELQLRSKEPVLAPGTVTLTTIHGAKGREFDTVYLIGLAEEVLPSWHSVRKGDGSAAIEEERRGCFVAITRTRRRLILSRARYYRGWPKAPSRFLGEMGCLDGQSPYGSTEAAG